MTCSLLLNQLHLLFRCRLFVCLSLRICFSLCRPPSLVSPWVLPPATLVATPADAFFKSVPISPVPLEFESTPQNRRVTKRSYVSPLPCHATKGFEFSFSVLRYRRGRRRNARAARSNGFSEPLLAARCSCRSYAFRCSPLFGNAVRYGLEENDLPRKSRRK